MGIAGLRLLLNEKRNQLYSIPMIHDFIMTHGTFTLGIGLTFLACWISWRVWRFTILPLLRPKDPVELPYWIPCKAYSLILKPL